MLSFLWPDQTERIERLRAALDFAARVPIVLDTMDADDWLEQRLRGGPSSGVATVVFHSIVWQYLPNTTKEKVRAVLAAAGAEASPTNPLLWLRMEPAGPLLADLRLTTWPGGAEEVVAEVGYHGAGIRVLVNG